MVHVAYDWEGNAPYVNFRRPRRATSLRRQASLPARKVQGVTDRLPVLDHSPLRH